MNAPAPSPLAEKSCTVFDFGRLPACMTLDAERTAELAHHAARLKCDLARVEVGGQVIFVQAKHDGAREAAHLIRIHGLQNRPGLAGRPELRTRVADTAQP